MHGHDKIGRDLDIEILDQNLVTGTFQDLRNFRRHVRRHAA
jgi:hypothetical protein